MDVIHRSDGILSKMDFNAIDGGRQDKFGFDQLEKRLENLETWMKKNLGYVNVREFDTRTLPSPPSPVKDLIKIPNVIIKTEVVDVEGYSNVQASNISKEMTLKGDLLQVKNNIQVTSKPIIPSVCAEDPRTKKVEAVIISASNNNKSLANTSKVDDQNVNPNQPGINGKTPPIIIKSQVRNSAPMSILQPDNDKSKIVFQSQDQTKSGNRKAVLTTRNVHPPLQTSTSLNSSPSLPPTSTSSVNKNAKHTTTTDSAPASTLRNVGKKLKAGVVKMHHCKFCGKMFPNDLLLQKHISYVHKKYKCRHCKRSFEQHMSLQQHLYDSHNKQIFQRQNLTSFKGQRPQQQQQQQQNQQRVNHAQQVPSLTPTFRQTDSCFPPLSRPQSQTPQMPQIRPQSCPNPNVSTQNVLQRQQPAPQQFISHFTARTNSSVLSSHNSIATGVGAIIIPQQPQEQQNQAKNRNANPWTRFEKPNKTIHACTICRKSFAAVEHLTQHLRTHPSFSTATVV